ncbi:PKD domain-containing protein [Larkinella insperata]|uniref:PKD domain-containing protein n=1 Tax=Larkinella insperata TaxID=332158 RepID=A0ABW3Q9I5_9BACT|nr:PKD domain-containing protein [Larkinella insperata]
MRINRILVVMTATTLLLSGCKKDTEPSPDKDPDPTQNPTSSTLVAEAGADQAVQLGATVTLDGSGSKDSGNKTLTYQWAITQKPASSTVTLSTATAVKTTFVPDKAGDYEIELTISNGKANQKDKVKVTVTPIPTQAKLLDEVISAKTVLEDRVPDPALPDYIVDKRLVVQAELAINPGVTIAFARDAQFNVTNTGGILVAKGEAAKRIRFIGKEATKGFWQGLWITSESSGNVLENVDILHGGGRVVYMSAMAGLTLSGKAQLNLKNTLISESDGYGLHAADGTVLREFVANKFSNNTESGVFVSADNVKALDAASVYTAGNGRNLVEILKSNLSPTTKEIVWKALDDQTPYLLQNSVTVQSELRLEPGVVLKTSRNVIIAVDSKGSLSAVGTPEKRIKIGGLEAEAGYWRGLHYSWSASAKNRLEYVDLTDGGSSASVSGVKSNLAVSGSTTLISVKNCAISRSAGYGIFVTYEARNQLSKDAESVNKFEDNTQGTILIGN